MLHQSHAGFQQLQQDPAITRHDQESRLINPGTALVFNLNHKPLDDLRVRRAIAMAIDLDRAVRVMSQGRDDYPKFTSIGAWSPLFTKIANPNPFDPERANALLDEAGYVRNEQGIRFSLTLDALPVDKSLLAGADYYAYELQRLLGIEVVHHRSPSVAEWAGRLIKGEYALNYWAIFDWNDPYFSLHRLFHSVPEGRSRLPFTNNMGYSNPLVDQLLDQAGAEIDQERRRALYAKIQRQLLEDLPVVNLIGFELPSFYHKDLVGFNENAWGVLAPYDQIRWRDGGD
jgi:peptide/nickel transport system substrate-binding protein